MKCYLINLDRAPERLARMTRLLAGIGVDFERVAAIDGMTFTSEELAKYRQQGITGFDLAAGDIACGATHLAILEKIANGSDEYAAVMEDDLILSADVGGLLNSTDWIPKGADIVKLETCYQATMISRKRIKLKEGRYISALLERHWGAAIYVISKSTAEKVLKEFTAGKECIDNHFFGRMIDTHKIYQVFPAVGVQGAAVTTKDEECLVSDIERQRGDYPGKSESLRIGVKVKGFSKLKREVLRIRDKLVKGVIFIWLYAVKGQVKKRIAFKA